MHLERQPCGHTSASARDTGNRGDNCIRKGAPHRGIRSPFDWLPLETQWPRSIELPSPRITMAPERCGGLVPNSRLPNSQFHFIAGGEGMELEGFWERGVRLRKDGR